MRLFLSLLIALAAAFMPSQTATAATTLYAKTFAPKNGGARCYYRAYSKAFLRQNPQMKASAFTLEAATTTPGGSASTPQRFGVNFAAFVGAEKHEALATCTPQSASRLTCTVSGVNGGAFTIQRLGKASIRVFTRRTKFDGYVNDLVIASPAGGKARSFTLKGDAGTCESIFD